MWRSILRKYHMFIPPNYEGPEGFNDTKYQADVRAGKVSDCDGRPCLSQNKAWNWLKDQYNKYTNHAQAAKSEKRSVDGGDVLKRDNATPKPILSPFSHIEWSGNSKKDGEEPVTNPYLDGHDIGPDTEQNGDMDKNQADWAKALKHLAKDQNKNPTDDLREWQKHFSEKSKTLKPVDKTSNQNEKHDTHDSDANKRDGEDIVQSEKRDTESTDSASHVAGKQQEHDKTTDNESSGDLTLNMLNQDTDAGHALSKMPAKAHAKPYEKTWQEEAKEAGFGDDIYGLLPAKPGKRHRCNKDCRKKLALYLLLNDPKKRDLNQVDGSVVEEEKSKPQATTATSPPETPWADRDRSKASWWENFKADEKEKATTTE